MHRGGDDGLDVDGHDGDQVAIGEHRREGQELQTRQPRTDRGSVEYQNKSKT